MIHVQNIDKNFGSKKALDDVSFSIEHGQYVALLGVNGAGKTTLTRILATLSRPSCGKIEIAGFDPKKKVTTSTQSDDFTALSQPSGSSTQFSTPSTTHFQHIL